MSDLSIATREMFARSFIAQVGLKMPILAMLLEHRKVTTKGGSQIVYDLIKDDAEDEVQAYGPNDQLTTEQSEFLGQAKFNWKYAQCPMKYGVDTEIKNQMASSEVKRRDVVKLIVKRAQDGIKRHLNTRFHTTSTTDAGKGFQSIFDGSDHGRTYGEITSSTSANTWWNGASLATSWSDRATAMNLSLSNLRLMKAICKRYADATDKLYLYLPEALYSKLQGLLEGKTSYQPSTNKNSKLFKYGFDSFQAYGIEVVQDSWMTLNSQTGYAMLMNPSTWEFRIHPKRAFSMTKFVHQAQISGNKDEHVARIYVAGNLCCNKPNANMWKSNVS